MYALPPPTHTPVCMFAHTFTTHAVMEEPFRTRVLLSAGIAIQPHMQPDMDNTRNIRRESTHKDKHSLPFLATCTRHLLAEHHHERRSICHDADAGHCSKPRIPCLLHPCACCPPDFDHLNRLSCSRTACGGIRTPLDHQASDEHVEQENNGALRHV